MAWVILFIYGTFILFIFSYSLVQLHLVFLFWKSKKTGFARRLPDVKADSLPKVTVQLPIYNERYVVERLIDAVARFDYPRDLLEIQILDDSNDETVALIAQKVKEWQAQGLDIQHIRRPARTGFKAGALAYGLELAQGELIAIFDADFLPYPDFLKETVPAFQDEKIGVVQTRWRHLNEDYSLLTRLQAFTLNAHFNIEQTGRNQGDHFINFNGTAGVWRKKCIEEAGGWQSDTLTEDLDLSYRAQLIGWKFKYLGHVGTPAELPVAMNAMKTQQFRWTKGAAECTRKNLGKVWRCKGLKWTTKTHALFHLMNSAVFLCVAVISILSIPLLWVKASFPELKLFFQLGSIFLVSMVFLCIYYWASYREDSPPRSFLFLRFLGKFFLFLAVSMGFSLHNAIAVFEGYIGRKTPFIRTPKFNVSRKKESWHRNQYLIKRLNPLTWIEGILMLYFLGGVYLAFHYWDFGLLPFHLLLSFGFGYIFFYTLRHSRVGIQKT